MRCPIGCRSWWLAYRMCNMDAADELKSTVRRDPPPLDSRARARPTQPERDHKAEEVGLKVA